MHGRAMNSILAQNLNSASSKLRDGGSNGEQEQGVPAAVLWLGLQSCIHPALQWLCSLALSPSQPPLVASPQQQSLDLRFLQTSTFLKNRK